MTREEIIQGLSLIPIGNLIVRERKAIEAAIAILRAFPETLSRRDEMASRVVSGLVSSDSLLQALKGDEHDLAKASIKIADALITELDKEVG